MQDINLRLVTLPPPRSLAAFPVHLQNPLPLPQLSSLLNLLNHALDIIDISAWTGDPHSGSFIAGQLKLLADTIEEARQILKMYVFVRSLRFETCSSLSTSILFNMRYEA